MKQGWYWPWAILAGTFAIIGLSVYTVDFALKNPVQLSNDHINKYKYVEKNINEMILAKIEFDKDYILRYLPTDLNTEGAQIRYEIKTKEGNGVSGASFEALLTRPNEVKNDISLEVENVKEGVYTFKKVKLPLPGRWDLFVNVSLEGKKTFSRLRLDTRYPNDVLPFGTALPMN